MESNTPKGNSSADSAKSSGSLPAWKWTGAEALQLVHELNERCLEMLAKLAEKSGSASRREGAFKIVTSYEELWRGLDATARGRAAQCPFLLVDAEFQSETWWRSAKDDGLNPAAGALNQAFSPKIARELMGETLMLAWLTARSDRRTATLLFGMASPVADIIASLRPREIRRIVARHSSMLRPRWGHFPPFWQQLLLASERGDDESLLEVHLHGLQLLGSQLIPTSA